MTKERQKGRETAGRQEGDNRETTKDPRREYNKGDNRVTTG